MKGTTMNFAEKAGRIEAVLGRVADFHDALVAVGAGLSRMTIGTGPDRVRIWTGNDRYEIHKGIRRVFGDFGIVETVPPVGASDENPIYITDATMPVPTWGEYAITIDTDPYLGYVTCPRAPRVALGFVQALHQIGGLPVDSVSSIVTRHGTASTTERVTISRHGPRDPLPQDLADKLTQATRARHVRFNIDWVDDLTLVSVIKARPERRVPKDWTLQGTEILG